MIEESGKNLLTPLRCRPGTSSYMVAQHACGDAVRNITAYATRITAGAVEHHADTDHRQT
jgi:hypothetical protein